MTTTSQGQTIVEPAVPSRPEAVPKTEPAGADGHDRPRPLTRRWRRRQKKENFWRNEILSRLEKPGCLICHEAKTNLRRYYFWFLEEQYANFQTMDRLQRAHGFCLHHTRHLLQRRAPAQTSYVASYVLQYYGDWLRSLAPIATIGRSHRSEQGQREPVGFGPLADCPACEDERATSQRYVEVVVGCLKDEADVFSAFRESDGLCLPHFLAATRVASWETLQILTKEQIQRLEEDRANLLSIQMKGMDGAMTETLEAGLKRLHGPDMEEGIRPFLVAHRRADQAPADTSRVRVTAGGRASASWSPAFDEACRLMSQPGCSLCRVIAGGREEYLAWLEEEIRDFTQLGYRWNQALYLCGQHAWLFADRCAPEVLAAACCHLLGQMVEVLRNLLWEIREPISPALGGRVRALPARWRESAQPEGRMHTRPSLCRRVQRTLRTLWITPQKFLDGVRQRTLRWPRCPLCEHLETIEARAADRLLAVLADAEGWRTFERSYGVCLHHAPLLLERADEPAMRRDVAALLLARIEVDRWDVEEYRRKESWNVRHEPDGAEEGAWVRASTRLAGMAIEQDYGF